MGPASASSSLVLLPSIMDRCQRQEMLFGLSPDGWRVFGAKLSPESVAVGSTPTRLTGETSLGPVPFGKCLRRWSWGFRTKATSWWRWCAGLALSSVHISLRHAACGAVWLERRTQAGDSLGPGPNAISFHPFTWFPFGPVSADPICAESLKGGDQRSRERVNLTLAERPRMFMQSCSAAVPAERRPTCSVRGLVLVGWGIYFSFQTDSPGNSKW